MNDPNDPQARTCAPRYRRPSDGPPWPQDDPHGVPTVQSGAYEPLDAATTPRPIDPGAIVPTSMRVVTYDSGLDRSDEESADEEADSYATATTPQYEGILFAGFGMTVEEFRQVFGVLRGWGTEVRSVTESRIPKSAHYRAETFLKPLRREDYRAYVFGGPRPQREERVPNQALAWSNRLSRRTYGWDETLGTWGRIGGPGR